jgi:hypothetical protein
MWTVLWPLLIPVIVGKWVCSLCTEVQTVVADYACGCSWWGDDDDDDDDPLDDED